MLESGSRPVAPADALIAACAWELGLILATRNVEDFRGFGVPLDDPFEQAAARPALRAAAAPRGLLPYSLERTAHTRRVEPLSA